MNTSAINRLLLAIAIAIGILATLPMLLMALKDQPIEAIAIAILQYILCFTTIFVIILKAIKRHFYIESLTL